MKSFFFSTILGAVLLVSQAAAAPQASTTTLHCTNPGAVLGPYEEPINCPSGFRCCPGANGVGTCAAGEIGSCPRFPPSGSS
ncbi:hypothetical protein CPC08DRAFT_704941 [Agrocybe pediades]|nr:hypothetical protein CPC08DRAFT_704941 [Agrocybe pediades]